MEETVSFVWAQDFKFDNMPTKFQDKLETFDNEFPNRDYTIKIECPEFTSVCPKTGQPDFGIICFQYVPESKCVELKSLKMYLQSFRDEGIFYENVVNSIFEDFIAKVEPRKCSIVAEFTPRGGISSIIEISTDE